MPDSTTIVVAGATGNLGGQIVKSLIKEGATVRALVRPSTTKAKREILKNSGAAIVEVNLRNPDQVAKVCEGASCVVSALLGLRDVIVDTQQTLLEGSIKASVPRFIPSDFSFDYKKWPRHEDRTLDLRRDFSLNNQAIPSTSILTGTFMDLLLSPSPAFNLEDRTVTCWGDPDYKLEFTRLGDVAAFTALAALDESTPGTLRIVGERISARELAAVAEEVTGAPFELIQAGSISDLSEIVSVLQLGWKPNKTELYPEWQSMMSVRTMFSGAAEVEPFDNQRYPDLHWTSVRELLETHLA
ncbi:NmrA family NAD(P)-binding protein [Granulicella sp. dw_53]|uniref:NmrA family NAD(P)-binding protein n=1 Tax=Granulicella sp. dw_53 TaxID=2719792 RepID=UPI001BD2C945|nr:NmrA family NAD(P)-binding protein [Granulicella sp. dw_53]